MPDRVVMLSIQNTDRTRVAVSTFSSDQRHNHVRLVHSLHAPVICLVLASHPPPLPLETAPAKLSHNWMNQPY